MNVNENSKFTDSRERRLRAQDLAARRSLAHAERWVDIGVAFGSAARTAARALVGLRRPKRDAQVKAGAVAAGKIGSAGSDKAESARV